MGSTVSLGDAQVRQADILVGDDDGVVVIPAAYEEKVLEVANEIAEREASILSEAIEKGSLREARAHYGYHLLQRRESTED